MALFGKDQLQQLQECKAMPIINNHSEKNQLAKETQSYQPPKQQKPQYRICHHQRKLQIIARLSSKLTNEVIDSK